jgi:hypothetical protein
MPPEATAVSISPTHIDEIGAVKACAFARTAGGVAGAKRASEAGMLAEMSFKNGSELSGRNLHQGYFRGQFLLQRLPGRDARCQSGHGPEGGVYEEHIGGGRVRWLPWEPGCGSCLGKGRRGASVATRVSITSEAGIWGSMLGREAGVICSCVVFFGIISHCTGLTDLGPWCHKHTRKYLCAQQVYLNCIISLSLMTCKSNSWHAPRATVYDAICIL